MPTGVKIISILYYVYAGLLVSFVLLFFFGAGLIGSISPGLAVLGAVLGIVSIVIFSPLAILSFFIGRGLWRGKNWARLTAGILSILGVLSSLFSIIVGSFVWGAVWLVINGPIVWYLLLNEDVKAAFH